MSKFKVGDRVIRINIEDSPTYIVSHVLEPAFDDTCHCYVIKHSSGGYYTSILAELCLEFSNENDVIPRYEVEWLITFLDSGFRLTYDDIKQRIYKILDKYKEN